MKSYKRLSIKRSGQNKVERWIYTDKEISEDNLTYGDTWSFNYKDILQKDYDINKPDESEMYTTEEVIIQLEPEPISHYHGKYNSSQDWNDDSGQAYRIRYENGKIAEIYIGKGH